MSDRARLEQALHDVRADLAMARDAPVIPAERDFRAGLVSGLERAEKRLQEAVQAGEAK